MRKLITTVALALGLTTGMGGALAQTKVGEVETAWKMVGSNDKIVVERFDDPKVRNASCYVSRAERGGITGDLGLAEERSRFSIACRSTGPVEIMGDISEPEDVWTRKQSVIFKKLHVTRMYDDEKGVITYLVWSDKALDGSPFSSLSAIVVNNAQ